MRGFVAIHFVGHIGVERDVAVLHFTVEEGEHIDERHGVIGKTADDLAVIAAVGGIGSSSRRPLQKDI